MAKRGVDVRFLDKGDVQKMGGDKVKQVLKVRNGLATEDSKKIQKVLKESKLKVQASIQGDAVATLENGKISEPLLSFKRNAIL